MSQRKPTREELAANPSGAVGEGESAARAAAAQEAAQSESDARTFAIQVARVAAENRTEDVTIVDLRGLSGVADFFIIGTGTSDRQMRAALQHIAEFAKTVGRRPFRTSDSDSTWNLADYVDVIVHIFDAQNRTYYDLDGLWGDAPRVEWQQSA